MKLISTMDQNLDGNRRLKTGEEFEISEKSGRLLIAMKRARLAKQEEPEKGSYKRRDMRAEK